VCELDEGQALALGKGERLGEQAGGLSRVSRYGFVGEEADVAQLVEPLVGPSGGGVGQ